MTADPGQWRCPVCRGERHQRAFRSNTTATEGGVDARRFRPASADFGTTAGVVVRCEKCGHGSLLDLPDEGAVAGAYLDAADPATLREEEGQVATAARDVAAIDAAVAPRGPGRLVDVGCWTGSFVDAAARAGWKAEGIEPSAWAASRAHERGLNVRQVSLGENDGLEAGAFRAVVACDVLEHLLDPADAVARIAALLEPGGVLFATVPDAGSRLARVMGSRWWSVLPMHVQYYTRSSLTRLLGEHGLKVRSITTHAKLFSWRYYGERVAELVPVVGAGAARLIAHSKRAERLVGPDLRDRMAVIAERV
jgi:SAM-dependent methyltransferase